LHRISAKRAKSAWHSTKDGAKLTNRTKERGTHPVPRPREIDSGSKSGVAGFSEEPGDSNPRPERDADEGESLETLAPSLDYSLNLVAKKERML
jgi:hypothetical protein